MTVKIVLLDPGDQGLIDIDWADVLLGATTLSSVLHTVPSPLTKLNEATNAGTGHSQVKVSGALHGAIYMIEAAATLANGETINRQIPARGWNS